jgi:general secretion pathway protein E
VLRDLANDELTNQRYADTMRALMRGDPDAVMLGEIRDKLTAMFALQIAETGHLAMGTVHAHLISTIVPRLTNDQIGVSRQALTGPNILNLLVYQALVPKVCQSCALTTNEAIADPEVAELVELLHSKFNVPTSNMRWQRAGGCQQCNQRGTKGKTIVAEMLRPDRVWLKKVRQCDDDGALEQYRSASDGCLQSPDMTGKTVFEHTLYKALQGQVDVRSCEEFESFTRAEVLVRPLASGVAKLAQAAQAAQAAQSAQSVQGPQECDPTLEPPPKPHAGDGRTLCLANFTLQSKRASS